VRDIFVAIFFVSIGTLIRPASLLAEWPAVLALVLLVIAGKFAVWTLVVRAAGYPVATARNAALGLTQIGEFSYILAGVGRNHGLLPSSMYDAVLATSLVTILINALVFRRRPTWVQRLVSGQETVPPPAAAAVAPEVQVTVCGFGRVGREVADALDAFHIPYTVVDLDPEATREARSRVPVRSSGTPAAKASCTMPGWTVPSWRWWRSLSSRQPAGVSRPCGRSDPISPF